MKQIKDKYGIEAQNRALIQVRAQKLLKIYLMNKKKMIKITGQEQEEELYIHHMEIYKHQYLCQLEHRQQ